MADEKKDTTLRIAGLRWYDALFWVALGLLALWFGAHVL